MFFTADTSLRQMRDQIARIRSLAAEDAKLDETCAVSGWCPAEHLDHLIKVSASIVNRLLQMDATAGGGVSLTGRIVLAVGRIPRGRGKSPERVRGQKVGSAELYTSIEKLESKIALLSGDHLSATRGAIVPHPRFGGLRPAQALRFAVVHNDHHLRIVDDIRKHSR